MIDMIKHLIANLKEFFTHVSADVTTWVTEFMQSPNFATLAIGAVGVALVMAWVFESNK